jgi:hypothetical protein
MGDIFFNQADNIIKYCTYNWKLYRSKKDESIAITQEKLNKLHQGFDFTLSYR